MDNKFAVGAVLLALVGAMFGFGYFLFTDGHEVAMERDESHDKKNEAHKQEEPARRDDAPSDSFRNFAPSDSLGSRDDNKAAPAHNNQAATPPLQRMDPQQKKAEAYRDEVLKQQVPVMYDDLFKELSITDDQRVQVEKHLAQSIKSEADFEMKLFDPKVSVEDLIREQDRVTADMKGGLRGVLTPTEQDIVSKHQNDLPKKAESEQMKMLVDSLNLQGADRDNVQNAVDRAIKNLDPSKHVGQYSAQDITELRKQFGNAKPGDAEFMKANIELSEKRVSGFLKELEHLPKDQYEAIKKQVQGPLDMMKQNMQQQGQQGARN